MSENITKEEIIEQFKGNKILKYSTIVVGVIAVVVLAVLAYNYFISGPNEKASEAEIANAIMYLENDSTQLATEEFEYLTSEYDGYKGGEVAQYALGNLYFEQGNYEAALNELKGVKIEDTYLMTLAIGTQGDCYSELGDYKNAVKMYVKAAERKTNDVTTPMFYYKAGLNAEEAGDFAKAAEYYTIIKSDYLSFASQKGIDKYITRAENSVIE
ncbi:tetratricopeptide repeat protein [Brumimicrobium mesophilum]|uniref:tetratricopeptide repeat protein n=1 Tax=Brumimicrobium mesophilum TaxID=392717 RepID=UPI000D143D66|nr:tetratricopeptide repeat protein [Brumimicrobium mesophilum]